LPPASPPKAKVLVSAFDGTRTLIPSGKSLLFRFLDGTQKQVLLKSQKKPQLKAALPFANNFTDRYTVIVSGKGYRQAGFHPVPLDSNAETLVDLMLLPNDATFRFHEARWSVLRLTHPKWTTFLKGTLSEAKAEERHGQWMEDTPEHLAAFLNFAEAMDDVRFRIGTGFDCLKQPLTNRLPEDFLVDRFFAFADAVVVQLVEDAVREGTFEPANSSLHPGATRSFKEVRFGEANLQVTLHEKDRKVIGGVKCVKVEIDMDYFRDPAAHLLLEVLPNQFGGSTDPRQIYVLRWIAGRRARVSEFNPPYHIAV
jgi:hypothetical protein